MSTLRSARRLAGVASTLAIMLGAIADAGSGCGDGESVVGGRCVSGYSPCGSTCCLIANQTDGSAATGVDRDAGLVEGSAGGADSGRGDEAVRQSDDASVSDSSEPSAEASAEDSGEDGKKSSTDDAGAEAGFSCAPPSVDCNGVCVDPGTFVGDPNNCGGCGIECPSQLCQSSRCVGSTVGGFVYIGHDFSADPASFGPASVLANAVFMPRNNPLHVMSYERYAETVAVLSVDAVIEGSAGLLGRQLSLTASVFDSDIPARLSAQSYDVLVVHDQAGASSGAMAALGASWASTLTTFTQQHGIVVVIDGDEGVGEMPQFASGTGLLQVSAHLPTGPGTEMQVLAPADAVGLGVVSPYASIGSSVFLTTEPSGGNVVYVVAGMQASQDPVVVHKVF